MKKLLICAFVLLLAFSLAACNKVPNDTPSSSSSDEHTHSYSPEEIVEPTCEQKGYTLYVCSCGDSYKEYSDPLGHTFDSEVTLQPTCSQPGEIVNYCYCGYSYAEAIDPVEHIWDQWIVEVEPTYTTTGSEYHVCVDCGASESRETPTCTVEEEMYRLAKLASMLPYFDNVSQLTAGNIFDWVRVQAGFLSSNYDEQTYMVTLVYSVEKFDKITQQYFGKTFDFAAYATAHEDMTYDAATKQLTWVTGGAGGWAMTAFSSYVKIDDSLYCIDYYNYYEENVPMSYGMLNVKLTDNGFIFVSHTE